MTKLNKTKLTRFSIQQSCQVPSSRLLVPPSAARGVPPHLTTAPCVMRVVQPCEEVLVSGLVCSSSGKDTRQAESSLAEVVLQAQSMTGRHKLLPSGVAARYSSYSPPVDLGQVPLLLFSQGPTVDWTTVF